MIYFIPEEIYDELLPISMSITPSVMKRVGIFYITDIPINEVAITNLTVKGCVGFGPDEVRKTEWIKDLIFSVDFNLSINCCHFIGDVSVVTSGNVLTINIEVIIENNTYCRCMCAQKFHLEIGGLEKQEYMVVLNPIEVNI